MWCEQTLKLYNIKNLLAEHNQDKNDCENMQNCDLKEQSP